MSYILIAEDELYFGKLLKRHLSEVGRHVLHVENGAHAISCIRQATPHLLLLDMLMPGMNGFEVLEAIQKREEIIRPANIIVISNLEQEEDVQTILQLGADQYIGKSNASFEEIVEIVKEILHVEYTQ